MLLLILNSSEEAYNYKCWGVLNKCHSWLGVFFEFYKLLQKENIEKWGLRDADT